MVVLKDQRHIAMTSLPMPFPRIRPTSAFAGHKTSAFAEDFVDIHEI